MTGSHETLSIDIVIGGVDEDDDDDDDDDNTDNDDDDSDNSYFVRTHRHKCTHACARSKRRPNIHVHNM